MNSRLWPGLLLACTLPTVASSQSMRPSRPPTLKLSPQAPQGGVIILPGADRDRPSHRPVGSDLESLLRPEEAIAARLKGVRDQKGLTDQLLQDKEMRDRVRDIVQRLLRDKEFADSIKGQFNREDVENALGGVARGQGGVNPELMKSIAKGLADNRLNEETKDLAKRLQDKLGEPGTATPPEGGPGQVQRGDGPPPATPPAATPAPPAPDPQPWKLDPKTEAWLSRNLDRWAKDLDRWAAAPGNEGLRGLLKDFARRYDSTKALAPGLVERAGGLTKYLPRMSNYLPRPRLSKLPDLPRLPLPSRLGLPSAPSGRSATTGGKVLLGLLVFGVAAFLVWRVGGFAGRARQGRSATWQPGPWPVRPGDVKTRGDLVRAFEHLALMCLGRPARTHHHHDLARQIGAQPSLDPDRRKDAAEQLAAIYEHARYRPDREPLPEDEIRRARRELCYLAGVAAA